jgi:hypothetical protein
MPSLSRITAISAAAAISKAAASASIPLNHLAGDLKAFMITRTFNHDRPFPTR